MGEIQFGVFWGFGRGATWGYWGGGDDSVHLEEFIVRQLGEIRAPLRYLNGITCGVSYYVKNKLKGELFGERTTSRASYLVREQPQGRAIWWENNLKGRAVWWENNLKGRAVYFTYDDIGRLIWEAHKVKSGWNPAYAKVPINKESRVSS
jgi:hypothetical protein